MELFAFVSLTTPAMLGGLALLTLPIAAHLLHRHARRQIVFPTIALLRESVATQSRLFRLRRWILLALRCMAVALLVAAFARPLWVDPATPGAGNASGSVGVVLLLDTSVSTGQQNDGVPVIHELRTAADRTLDSLLSGTDVANVVYASALSRATFPRLSPNLPAIRQELSDLSSTYERADLPRAISLAGELLSKHEGRHRLVILSDLQRTNWREILRDLDPAELLPEKTVVTVVNLATPMPENMALSEPRQFPPQPLIGQPMELVVKVSNYSAGQKQVEVRMQMTGAESAKQTLVLGAGEQRDVSFPATLKQPAAREVTFSIPADGLAADNRSYLAVKPVDHLPVVVVSDDDPDEPGSATYFLTRALAPRNSDSDRYVIRQIRSRAVSEENLRGAAALFVGYVSELSETAARALAGFVEAGGGMLIFCGEGAVDRNLRVLDAEAKGGLLPWEPGPARPRGGIDDSLYITSGKWQSRMLREFDEQSQVAIGQIRFARIWTTGPVRPDAQVLLSFSDGTPALAARGVGSGRLLVANFSPSLTSSDLGKYGAFVAMTQILAQQLRPTQASSLSPVVGEPYRHPEPFPLAMGAGNLQVFGPDNQPVVATTTIRSGQMSLQMDRVDRPGFYRIRQGTETVAVAAINIDPRESDLKRLTPDELLKRFARTGVGLEIQSAEGWDPVLQMRGRPLWGWCVTLAMFVVGLELLCLGIWRR